jgi:hypothetical protein
MAKDNDLAQQAEVKLVILDRLSFFCRRGGWRWCGEDKCVSLLLIVFFHCSKF